MKLAATATYADLAELVSTIKKPEPSNSDASLYPEDEDEMFHFGEEDEDEEEDGAAEFSEGREEGIFLVANQQR